MLIWIAKGYIGVIYFLVRHEILSLFFSYSTLWSKMLILKKSFLQFFLKVWNKRFNQLMFILPFRYHMQDTDLSLYALVYCIFSWVHCCLNVQIISQILKSGFLQNFWYNHEEEFLSCTQGPSESIFEVWTDQSYLF